MKRRQFVKLCATGLGTLGCAEPTKNGSNRLLSKPNIVVVLVDQLREDSMRCWGRETTALANKGIVFNNMRSVAPWTYPSVLSLMSGLYPQQHGADGHLTQNKLNVFSPRIQLLQQTLKDVGYKTSAFVTNPFLHRWNNFNQGFDHFDAQFVKNTGTLRPEGKQFAVPEKMFADYVNKIVMKYFSNQAGNQPEFSYIHYIDVHGPWKGAPFTPNYRSSVEYIDKKIVELYNYFMERHNGNLLFIVTSDHGRSLGNDLELGAGPKWRRNKSSCHDFNLRIPFYILPSQIIQRSVNSNQLCSNIDFVPTIRDLLNLEFPLHCVGESLAPIFMKYAPRNPKRLVYAKVSAFMGFGDSLIFGDYKMLRFFNIETGEQVLSNLYHLATDPYEVNRIERSFPQLHRSLDQISKLENHFAADEMERIPDDLHEQLKSLGYLQ